MAISPPKYDWLEIKPGRVPIFICCWKGACRRSNMACFGGAPGGRNTHILGLVAHVDVGSWILLAVAVICISQTGHTFNMDRGSKCRVHAGQIRLSIYQNEGRKHDVFANFQVGKVSVSIGFNRFLHFSFFFVNWRASCFFYFLFYSTVPRGNPIPTQHGKRDNKKVKIAILEGSRFVHSGHFTST